MLLHDCGSICRCPSNAARWRTAPQFRFWMVSSLDERHHHSAGRHSIQLRFAV